MTVSTSNGEWSEYRRMIIDWHEAEVAARKEIQQRLEASNAELNEKLTASHKELSEKLDTISHVLTEINTERKLGKWALGGGIMGFLSMVCTAVLFMLGIK